MKEELKAIRNELIRLKAIIKSLLQEVENLIK